MVCRIYVLLQALIEGAAEDHPVTGTQIHEAMCPHNAFDIASNQPGVRKWLRYVLDWRAGQISSNESFHHFIISSYGLSCFPY